MPKVTPDSTRTQKLPQVFLNGKPTKFGYDGQYQNKQSRKKKKKV